MLRERKSLMKASQKILLFGVLLLLVAAAAGLVITSSWDIAFTQSGAGSSSASAPVVDERPLETALNLVPLAVTTDEQQFAAEAVHLGDHEVDMAFNFAFRNVAMHPTPLSTAAKGIERRANACQARVDADQANITRLTALAAKAPASRKDSLQQEVQLAQAQLSLDQDELDDAHQDLIRAGGDPRSKIQQALDEHEQTMAHKGQVNVGSGSNSREAATEQTTSHSILAQFRAWYSLTEKRKQIDAARQELLSNAKMLAESHEALDQQLEQKKAGQAQTPAPQSPSGSIAASAAQATQVTSTADAISRVRELSEAQKTLAEFDKRIEDEQALASIYANWSALVRSREHFFLHGILQSAFWILMILLLAIIAGQMNDRFFMRLGQQRKRMLTMRSVIRVSINGLAFILILLVLLGPPSQLATIIALAGAGLTVALKDFIVGFFGWFVLMGRNGIRPGDWVEINGVGGEVVEVGLLHTVLLETGNWADSGHPTGRKVTFVNSFAIEGHYFNFSTSGQWMWDELQILVPAGNDPYRIADEIQKIVTKETEANARLAEQEWGRVTPGQAASSFKAAPSLNVQPTGQGVNVRVRYLTRAHERHDVRTRLYREIVDLLQKKKIAQGSAQLATSPVSENA
jgi:small-conductance mechanosensitive channel